MNARETHHGTLNSCLIVFRNVWVHLGPFCYCTKLDANGQSGAIIAKDRATNSRHIFSLRTHTIHTVGHYTHVLLHFVMFECIWDHFVTALNSFENEPNWSNYKAKVCATKSRWNFSLRTHPIHTKGPNTHVLLHFVMFGCISDRFVTAINSVQNGLNWCN